MNGKTLGRGNHDLPQGTARTFAWRKERTL